ncbi:Iron-sulfur cluster repair protein YtfE [Rubripirellula lacrimiformis]|uniref:Iron-sulfur cluster repair protein YtfE n=1 Tax=Rubripirellula lacrimiformis TaxID=1930273 RepID=A0A517ND14_9BACT|nr:DUF542 domain-containing protein [Rubripirellula lacrimiformis]QDT05025.1 Iron-sulfur cluster repair protein YtfE [Rubripirellula lacrimiformis]
MSGKGAAVLHDDSAVGLWVAQHPETAEVFEMLQIDYCCDGNKPLENACWENGLEVLRVHSLLAHTMAESANADQPDWLHASLTQLCDHIEQTHHALLKSSLPMLGDLISEIVSLHSQTHEGLRDVQLSFVAWRDEIVALMEEEEASLFPAIRRLEVDGNGSPSDKDFISTMIHRVTSEHTDIGEALKMTRKAGKNASATKDGSTKISRMYGLLRWVESDVRHHVHIEESILFPRVLAALAS